MKKILSKMFIVLQVVIILLPNISAYAIENTKEILEENVEEIIIQHYDTQNQKWKDVKITKYYYKDCEDNKIPVYILNKGTDKEIKIDTSNIEQIEDIRIATILKNGYTIENKTNLPIEDDAYLATYEALYWIINNKELKSINEELREIKEEEKLNESEEDEIIIKEEIKEKTEETKMEDTKQNIVKEEIIDEEVEDDEIDKKEESKTENETENQTQNEIISKVDSQEFTQDSVNENEAEKIEDNDKIALENSNDEVEKEVNNNLDDEVQNENNDSRVVIDNEENNNNNNVSNENLEEGKIIEDKKTNIINIEKETEAEEKEENANAEETKDDLENKENEEDKLQEEETEIDNKNNELNKRGQEVIKQIYNLVEIANQEFEKQEAEKEDIQESPNEEQEINESEKNENEEEIITPGKDSEEIQEEQEQESEETIEEKEEQIQEMPTEDTEIENTEDIKETERENPKIDINCYTKNTISSNAEHEYEFKIENTGNTAVENFTFYNVISNNTEKILRISTGTYNLEVNYNVYYKTSKNIEYTLLEEGLNSKENYNIDFAKINLKEDEIITEIKIEFGNVDKNFTNTENLRIYTKINDNLKNETQIKNYAILEANYNSYKMCEDIETVSTIYNTEVKRKLPKTGY